MALQWDESLMLGFGEIDNQHKLIFKHYNKLAEANSCGVSKEEIRELIDFLFDYCIVHFISEERIMHDYDYPNVKRQQQEHGEFTCLASDIIKRFEQEDSSEGIPALIREKLYAWIVHHIYEHDKNMVEYIKEYIALRKKYEK
ncbi:MAG: bacteriohemerythrin [Desulfuromonadaceae bacterium]|nr:bacteriohemerythrin [Desulfuromonadaceae bacterium]